MIGKELKKIIEKLIAAELGPKEGRYELLYPQEPKSKSFIKVIAVDEMQEDLPKPMQYHSRFASMLARKSLSELIQPEMIPLNISSLQLLVSPLKNYHFKIDLQSFRIALLAGQVETDICDYGENKLADNENSSQIMSVISTGQNKFILTIADNKIMLYAPRLYSEKFAKSAIIESAIHETVHVMTFPTMILEMLDNIKAPVSADYLMLHSQLPYELFAHALTPYIYREYTKDDSKFGYSEKKAGESDSYCDYKAVHEILSNNKTLEDAFFDCMLRVKESLIAEP